MTTASPVLKIGDAQALLVIGAPRGGRAHYQLASERLSAAMGRAIIVSQRPSGRPRLDAPDPELGVSLSYRDGALLIGYSLTSAVGVDIEPDDETLDPLALARAHFTAAEADAIARIDDAGARRDLFLRLWTAKEAVLKATGRGVYDGLDQPDLSGALDALQDDGRTVIMAPSPRIPASRAACSRIGQAHGPALYLALARLDD